jgi:AcrR family transcriptional regulator
MIDLARVPSPMAYPKTCFRVVKETTTRKNTVRGTSEAAQAKRRKKVMDGAVVLAARGGLDAVRIRDLVARTGVSSATIYRYFASKEHLLVAALAEQRFALRQPGEARPEGATPAERVISVLRAPTDARPAPHASPPPCSKP